MARHAARPSPEPSLACTATLQLIAVLSAKYEKQAHRFCASLAPKLEIFDTVPVHSPPLQPPMSLIINSLATLTGHDEPLGAPGDSWPSFNGEKLFQVLDLATRTYEDGDLEERSIPLVALLLRIVRHDQEGSKQRLRESLLPSDQDRAQPLGRGDSLPHRLAKISPEAVTDTFKKVMAHLFLELSDGDPKRLIHNVGFGCGIGLLPALGMPVPSSDIDDGEKAASSSELNPTTGQRRDLEAPPDLSEMTNEEKEREAERLFVLFERLRTTGVMQVENPVATAVRAGRIQELDSETSDG